jgi:rhodanese-related sulfurtransferase
MQKSRFLLTFLILSLSSSLLFGSASKKLYSDDITAKEAFTMQKRGAYIVDVRTPSEYIHTGHGLGYINIPVLYQRYKPKLLSTRIKMAQKELDSSDHQNARKLFKIKNLDNRKFVREVTKLVKNNKKADIILVCHSGERSEYAGNLLAKKGFKNVFNMTDGFFYGWQKANLPWSVD